MATPKPKAPAHPPQRLRPVGPASGEVCRPLHAEETCPAKVAARASTHLQMHIGRWQWHEARKPCQTTDTRSTRVSADASRH